MPDLSPNLSLQLANDNDNTEVYLVSNLRSTLQLLDTAVLLTNTQTLTNKTLVSPTLTSPTITSPTLTNLTINSGGVVINSGGVLVNNNNGVTIASGGGTLTVGGAANAAYTAYLTGTNASGTDQYGLVSDITLPTSATSSGTGLFTRVNLAASANVGTVIGLDVRLPTKGAGAAITTAHGIYVRAQTAAGQSNYGLFIEQPSGGGTSNYPLWVAGGTSQFNGAVQTTGGLTIQAAQAGQVGLPGLVGTRADGSSGSPTAVVSGDILTFHYGQAYNAGAYQTTTQVIHTVDAAPGATYVPGRLSFWTGTATAAPTERMRIDSAGQVGIGVVPAAPLHVTGPAVGTTLRMDNVSTGTTVTTGTVTLPAAAGYFKVNVNGTVVAVPYYAPTF